MSRIENALEKAAKLRKSTNVLQQESPGSAAGTDGHEKAVVKDQLKIVNPCIVTALQPHSSISEEYRKLKETVVSLTKQEEFRNMLMVTSSVPSEGKSVTALNLAVSLAEEFDNTVLLIDMDFRRPSVHSFFGITPEVGLVDCLLDGMDLSSAIINTGIGKLAILPVARKIKNPMELLSSQKTRDMLSEIKNRYRDRYIIIDTPPILPVADSRSISRMVDGVIFVIREGYVSLQMIQESFDALQENTILGIVYNDARNELHSSKYYYYGHYQDADQKVTA